MWSCRNLKKKSILVISLVIILSVSILGVSAILIFERPTGEEYKAIAERLLNEARQQFADIRGVTVREVTLEVVNRSWVAENWGMPSDSELEELHREENIYKALFMIPQDASLVDAQVDWTSLFHAAKWNGKIYIVEENFDITNEFSVTSTFVHELTHIMQDSYALPTRTTLDGSKALTSLKEGDATLMADTFKNNGVVPLSLIENTTNNSSLQFMLLLKDGVQLSLPESIDNLNRFPYRYGLEFVKTLYSQGGWTAIEEAYTNPPNTTEQIIHPEKYLSQESAKNVEVPPVPVEWNLIANDSYGEGFISIMLDNWISEDDAEDASKGWGGDVFSYYENGDEFLFTWNIVWDTEDDANDFYLAFQDMMYQASAEKHNCSYWSAYGRYISIQRSGNSTLIVSSADEPLIQQLIS
jgi:hypothetical protein